MLDNERISDHDIVRRIAALDNELAKLVQARLRRLRLKRVVNALPPPPVPKRPLRSRPAQ